MRKEAKFKSVAIDIAIVNLTADIASLSDKLKAVEMEMAADDLSFMLVLITCLDYHSDLSID